MLSQHRHTTTVTLTAGLSLELECTLAIQAGALSRGVACLSALLSGCQDRTILSKYSAWTRRDIDPDAVEEEAEEIEAAAAEALEQAARAEERCGLTCHTSHEVCIGVL